MIVETSYELAPAKEQAIESSLSMILPSLECSSSGTTSWALSVSGKSTK